MNATAIAVNHALGAIVVEFEDNTYAVIEIPSRFIASIGDTLTGDWQSSEYIIVQNTSQGSEFSAIVQTLTPKRSDAIGAVSLI